MWGLGAMTMAFLLFAIGYYLTWSGNRQVRRSQEADRLHDTLKAQRQQLEDTQNQLRQMWRRLPPPQVCTHRRRVPVNLTLTGEHVADICLDCDEDLPM